jgi:NAD(P)H-flavin reductase
MVDDSDRQRARGGLARTLRDLDALEDNLRACSDARLSETLREIERRRARQSTALLRWLRLGAAVDPQSEARQQPAPEMVSDSQGRPQDNTKRGSQRVQVLERREVTADLIRLKLQKPAGFTFLPGQSTRLELAGISRRYSIASAPHEAFLEFFIELVPGGEMSQQMKSLTGGEQVKVEMPKGSFLLDETFSTHLMVATVTGVTPFVSMLRHTFAANRTALNHRFVLLHGASYQDEFGFDAELQRFAYSHERFDYIPTISRPAESRNAGWSGEQGRVGTLVQPTIEALGLDPASTCLYACGHSAMVNEVAETFGSKGFTVKREVYD